MKARYGDLKFSKKIRSINESKQTLKSHISSSKRPRRVYNASNSRSWCQFLYFKWGCLYFRWWIEKFSFKITKKMQFSQLKQNVSKESSWLRNVLEQSIKAQMEGLEDNFHNFVWKKCYFHLVLRKKALKTQKNQFHYLEWYFLHM